MTIHLRETIWPRGGEAFHQQLEEAVVTRLLGRVLFACVIALVPAPPALAQAPAPKVTITGVFDQITSAGKNFYDGNFARDNDREWYARSRFRPDFTFEVGRTKALLGLEIDMMYGQAGPNDGGFPTNVSGFAGGVSGGTKSSTNGAFDLNTDVGGMIEIRWMYTEFDLTGKDSVLPFIPVGTRARAGAQPTEDLASYKLASYFNGDFAGVSTVTTFAPNIKTSLAFVIVEDQLAGGNRAAATARTSRGEDYAFIVSPEITPFKGLDLKPLFSYFHADGLTSAVARRNLANIRTVSGTTNGAGAAGPAPAGDATNREDRYTVGLDARWRSGPLRFEPTIYYQWGTRDSQAIRTNGSVGRVEADMSAWLIDLIAGFQLGPLALEGRAIYTPGNKARDNLARSIHYYQPLDTNSDYYAGWANILAEGIDTFNGDIFPMAKWIGYDRYGRASLGFRATYSITPALSVYGVVSPTWTAEKVDTDTSSVVASFSGAGSLTRTTVSDRSWVEGDSRYIGTEVDLGLTWRFAPNVVFDLVGAWLSAGDALNTAEVLNGVLTRRTANDAYQAAMRVRLAF